MGCLTSRKKLVIVLLATTSIEAAVKEAPSGDSCLVLAPLVAWVEQMHSKSSTKISPGRGRLTVT
jgi:hypothetical protein